MVLGLSSFTYGWSVGMGEKVPSQPMLELDLVQHTIDAALPCLQIGDNLPLHTFSNERLETLKYTLQKNSLRLEIGARKLTADHLQRYLQLTTFFNSPLLRFVIDGDAYEPDSKTIIRIIKEIIPELEKQNITLGIENHDRFKAKELAFIMDSVGSIRVGICLDCVNSMGAGEGLEHVLHVLAPYTVNLHIKDFTVERLSHKMGFIITGTPAGQGMTDVHFLMKELSHYNRCQSAILEQWVPFNGDIETTSQTEKQWAQQGINYLKSLPYFKY